MTSYVIDFFEKNHMFYKYPFGSQRINSTRHAIITLVERVSKALDTSEHAAGVFIPKRHSTR